MEVFLAKAMVELLAGDEGGANAAQASSTEAQDGYNGAAPLPPTPLSPLICLSPSSADRVILTGHDDTFVAGSARRGGGRQRRGVDWDKPGHGHSPRPLPSYYTSIYKGSNGQVFVKAREQGRDPG